MIKVSAIMMTQGSLQKQMLKGLRSSCDKFFGPNQYNIRLAIAKGPHNELLEMAIRQHAQDGAQVFITMGTQATQLTTNVLTQNSFKIPIVFCGLVDPVGSGVIPTLAHGTDMVTGISVEHDKRLMPVQLITLLNPSIKSIFLAYRSEMLRGRAEYESEKIKTYFEARDKTVFFHQITSSDEFNSRLLDNLKASDGVVIPESGLYQDDIIALTKAATNNNVPVYGYLEDALKQGAMFGCRHDLEFIGVKAGEYCYELIKKGKTTKDLPVAMLPDSRRVVFNPQALAQHGVTFSEDILASHDQAHDYPELPVKQFGKMMSYKNEFEESICEAVGHASRQDKQAVYFSETMSGRIFDREWQDAQTDFALESKQQLFFCIGKQLTHELAEKMVQKNDQAPIIQVCTKQELVEKSQQNSAIQPTSTVVLPDPDPLAPLKLLLLLKPNIKTVTLLCNIPEKSLPERYVNRLEKMSAFADQHNIQLTVDYEHTAFKLKEKLEDICSTQDGVCFFQDSVHESVVDWFAHHHQKYSALVCAGTSRHKGSFPLAYYLNPSAIEAELFAPIRAVLSNSGHTAKDSYPSYEQCYRITINEQVCQKKGIALPVGIDVLLNTKLD